MSIAISAAPAHALKVWVDNHHLFFELQGPHGPYVLEFARHELKKACDILFTNFQNEGHGQVYIRPDVPSKALQNEGLTQKDRDAAAAALKSLGIFK